MRSHRKGITSSVYLFVTVIAATTLAMASLSFLGQPVSGSSGVGTGSSPNYLGMPQDLWVTNNQTMLELNMALNQTAVTGGQGVSVMIKEYNPTTSYMNVSKAQGWPLPQLTLSPCGPLNLPMGIEVAKGYYTGSNISSAQPLPLFAPGVYACPAIFIVQQYKFQPSSDNATIFTESEGEPGLCCSPASGAPIPISYSLTISGYYPNGQSGNPVLEHFSPGIYTVAGGDEWGSLVLLHFSAT